MVGDHRTTTAEKVTQSLVEGFDQAHLLCEACDKMPLEARSHSVELADVQRARSGQRPELELALRACLRGGGLEPWSWQPLFMFLGANW